MQIERGASNTLVVMARVTLSPSYWLLHFTDIERGGNAYCVVQPGNSGGAFISLTFTETTAPVALDGEVLLAPPGNWNVKIYEQTSSTNLVPASANRLVKDVDVFVVGDGVADGGWTETCPTDGGECDDLTISINADDSVIVVPEPCGESGAIAVTQGGAEVGSWNGTAWVIPACDDLTYLLVNSDDVKLEEGSLSDPCGQTLELIAPDANIRTTDTLLNVAQVPSGDTYDLPQTSVMYANAFGITQLFLTDTTFDGVNLQTTDFILMADLRNSLGTALADVTAADLMNDTVPIAPDGSITFDGLPVGTVPSGDTENLDCASTINAAHVTLGGSGENGIYYISGTAGGKTRYQKDASHAFEYSGTRWVLMRPGSDHQAAVGNQAHPWLADWTGTGIAVDQGTISQYCGGNAEPCADLTIAINGTTYGTVADPCGATAPVNVHDTNGNDVGSLVSGAWVVAPPANVLREYTTGGTWSKPTSPSFKGVWVFAAGGGGAGGAGNVNVTNVTGGGGGGGGSLVRVWVPAASLLTTETYAIGAGAVSVATGNGGAGGATLFGAHVEAKGGGGGTGGSTSAASVAAGAGGDATLNTPVVNGSSISGGRGGTGARANATATDVPAGIISGANLVGSSAAAPGGGGGCGVSAGVQQAGKAGGAAWSTTQTSGGAAGTAGGGSGGSGVSDIYINPFLGLIASTIGIGTGGGGGGGITTGTAGNGGTGGRAAGGGGGGGTGSGTRGASGAGGDGFIILYEVFAI